MCGTRQRFMSFAAKHYQSGLYNGIILVLVVARRFQFSVSHEHYDWTKPPKTNDA